MVTSIQVGYAVGRINFVTVNNFNGLRRLLSVAVRIILPHAIIIVFLMILFACLLNVKHIYLNECSCVYQSRLTVQNGCRAPSVDPSLGTAGTSCRLTRCLLEASLDRQYTSYTNFITPCGHTPVVLFPPN